MGRVLRGTADPNIRFSDLCKLLMTLGFEQWIRGSHHIFNRPGVAEILNLQPRSGGMAKPYQVRQVRDIIRRHRLYLGEIEP
jgi:predicted RNA binding protein YcfA (HicA-like mRNA interferase family)